MVGTLIGAESLADGAKIGTNNEADILPGTPLYKTTRYCMPMPPVCPINILSLSSIYEHDYQAVYTLIHTDVVSLGACLIIIP